MTARLLESLRRYFAETADRRSNITVPTMKINFSSGAAKRGRNAASTVATAVRWAARAGHLTRRHSDGMVRASERAFSRGGWMLGTSSPHRRAATVNIRVLVDALLCGLALGTQAFA